MKIELKSSTSNITSKDEACNFSRAAARVCYSKYDFDKLYQEDSKTLIEQLLNSGHHSPFEHVALTFYISDIPKIGAMILNNEPPYVTSEKSARYTKMILEGEEATLYEKWVGIFEKLIFDKYSFIQEDKVKKLAMENARNLTSIFTPTKMLYTTSFRQINYLMCLFDDFIEKNKENTDFFTKNILSFMTDFNVQLEDLREKRLDPKSKKRFLRFFNKRESREIFSFVYYTKYEASFSYLAQAHRHRTINYSMSLMDNFKFFIPPILESQGLIDDWKNDMCKLKGNIPQGTFINVYESGTYFDFISKITERICGHAQLEIMNKSREILLKYLTETKRNFPEIYDELLPYANGPKCTFPNIKCASPCPFGPKKALERKI